jgi:hypothetical protein
MDTKILIGYAFFFYLPVAFILHDLEEIVVQHSWMAVHGESLCNRFPRFSKVIRHLMGMDTRAFTIAVMEELAVILIIYAGMTVSFIPAMYAIIALQMAFMLHLVLHIVQGVIVKGYVPGVVTSVLLLPVTVFFSFFVWKFLPAWQIVLCLAGGVVFASLNLWFAHFLGKRLTAGTSDK